MQKNIEILIILDIIGDTSKKQVKKESGIKKRKIQDSFLFLSNIEKELQYQNITSIPLEKERIIAEDKNSSEDNTTIETPKEIE